MRSLSLRILLSIIFMGLFIPEAHAQQQPASRPRRTSDAASQQPDGKDRSASTGQDEEVVKIDTDLTNLYFTAVDKNKRFVTTLRQEDIRVLEDGSPQEIFTFQRETDRPLSLAILIDTSVSQRMTLPDEKAAAQEFVDTIVRSGKDEVAVISFTGDATLEQDLTGSVALLHRAIDRVEIVLPPGYIGCGLIIPGASSIPDPEQSRAGTTAIWDAVWVTSDEILSHATDKRRRAIILVTDGVDTSSYKKRQEAIERAVQADVAVYVIGIGDSAHYEGVDKGTLRKLAEHTGGRAYFPKDETDLRASFTEIEQELRSQYLVAYSPSNKKLDDSYRQVQIEIVNPQLRKQKLLLNYRQGYFAKALKSIPALPSKVRQP